MIDREERFARGLAVALLAVLLAAPAAAEEAGQGSEAADEPVDTEFVQYVEVDVERVPESNSVVTKTPVPVDDTPANVGQVGRRLMQEQDARLLGDALRNVSSMHVVPFNGTFDYFLIRGFDSLSSSAVLTDGIIEPESTFYRSYNVQGVEVFKGPAGFLYGSNPLAGVVNVVRKQPLPGDFGTARLSGGSWNELEGAVDWNTATGDGTHAFRLNATYHEGDGWRDNTAFDHTAVNPAYTWQPDDRTRLNVNAELVTSTYGPDAGIPLYENRVPEVGRRTSYQSPFDRSEQDVARFQVDFERKLGDRVSIRSKSYWRSLEWLSDGTIFSGVVPPFPPFVPEPQVSRLLLSLDDEQRFYGTQFEAVAEVKTGIVEHRLLAGVEVARREDDYTLRGSCPAGLPQCAGLTVLPNLSLIDPVESATAFPDLLPFEFIDPSTPGSGDSRATIVAPYVVDQMSFGSRFQLMVGARYDDIAFRDPVNAIDRDDSDVSPMAGVVVKAGRTTTLYANAASSFAPASPRVVGDREPEDGEQVEVGVRQAFWGDRGRVTLAGYRLDRSNIAILDDNGFSQQSGDQRSEGVEVELALEPARRTRLLLSYAWTDAELTRFTETDIVGFDPQTGPIFGVVDRSGNRPAFAPEHLGNLWVSHSFEGGFEVGGGVRYIGEQFIAENNAFATDAVTLVDLFAAWTVRDWKLQLNLKNVTDETWFTRGFGAVSVTPGTPFAVTGAVEYRF